MIKWMLSVLFIIFSSQSFAGAADEIEKCYNMDSYRFIAGCYSDTAKIADDELNKKYKIILDYLKGPQKEKLIIAQRKWISFRDADCEFSAPLVTPNDLLELSNRGACVAKKTIARIKEFDEIIDWPMGCNGCPF